MSKLFNQTTMSKPGKSLIDLSHEKKLSMNMGQLVPFMIHEVVPGDKFRVNTESLIRLAPMVAPVMHRCNVYFHYFFVPNRLLMNDWEEFITGGEDGKSNLSMPTIFFNTGNEDMIRPGTLADYLGVPTTEGNIVNGQYINGLPFRAYQLIYNEYYRDQNIQPKVAVTKDLTISGAEKAEITQLRSRAWEKDYYTSCLPWSQRGDEVELPNTIQYKETARGYVNGTTTPAQGSMTVAAGDVQSNSISTRIENIDSIGITINDLRRSARLQEYLEKTARGGARLTEVIKSFFGVTSSDARLQRPEFLGGSRQPITISEVLATFDNAETAGGTMYGHGISLGNSNKWSRFFEEFGYVIGIMSVLPRTAYYQGIPRFLGKTDKFDLYWPTFAQLGEQEVYTKELFCDYTSAVGTQIFGYQSRYAEYKFAPSTIHGDFKKDSLFHWHMARKFTSIPALNSTFITSDPRHDIFAVTDETVHKLYVQLYNDVKAIRPMPYFNNPIL